MNVVWGCKNGQCSNFFGGYISHVIQHHNSRAQSEKQCRRRAFFLTKLKKMWVELTKRLNIYPWPVSGARLRPRIEG